jgi:hypothetical protein
MKAPPLANNYKSLRPDERYRLILAASGRGDVVERDRLSRSGQCIVLTMQDHAPFAHAFDELALYMFIELVDDAAQYMEDFERWKLAREDACDEAEETQGEENELEEATQEVLVEDDDEEQILDVYRDLLLASGYTLRAKAEGWKLFCERLNVPPFILWERLPGFERLQCALAVAEKIAFVPEGFLRWLNRVRPKEDPEVTELNLTVEKVAKGNDRVLHERVRWWGGQES